MIEVQVIWDEESVEFADEAYRLAFDSGIYISRNKQLKAVAFCNGELAGAIFADLYRGNMDLMFFEWDTVVAKKYRRKGVATRLIETAMRIKQELEMEYEEDIRYMLDIVSSHMFRYFTTKLGFIPVPNDFTNRLVIEPTEWGEELLEEFFS